MLPCQACTATIPEVLVGATAKVQAVVTGVLTLVVCLAACLLPGWLQIVMSAHKEQALDEKRYHFRFGATCVTGFSEAIHTSSYDNFEDFFVDLQTAWDKLWLQVFSADPAGVGMAVAVHGFVGGGACTHHLSTWSAPAVCWLANRLHWC